MTTITGSWPPPQKKQAKQHQKYFPLKNKINIASSIKYLPFLNQ
jgi:hypothetical protein